ncbi:glycosyltransferase family 2 protein [Pokkaliibacter plantistimulans]|uniref:Glycosyltransferase family 2 protein n=1 Tax=Proteobacteria bacterium 228 TaxID=2083153 RepID=A0A2S5KKW6_9PROT|nr:glycosyltransferase family 2 protein [Pokkaliibacter plantistimulans]PPC74956.1 glycosyltransferase family 2 protein [Pokkaliibacter plantistimulans]
MANFAVVVLTYNEELHIERCLAPFINHNIPCYVVDSFSTDGTLEIASSMGAIIRKNHFISQSQQFDWALKNADIDAEWILRMDADETLSEALLKKIINFTQNDGEGHAGAVLERKHIFLGRWIRHGGRYPVRILRLFRKGCAHIEEKWMDEHIVLDRGTSTILSGEFCDSNLNSISWFIDKHNKYASREVIDIILSELKNSTHSISSNTSTSIQWRRFLKNNIYLKLPPFIRPFCYFMYRYFLQLGFLDGKEGFAYHFMQGFWYRCLVDLKLLEARKAMAKYTDPADKRRALEKLTGYNLTDA